MRISHLEENPMQKHSGRSDEQGHRDDEVLPLRAVQILGQCPSDRVAIERLDDLSAPNVGADGVQEELPLCRHDGDHDHCEFRFKIARETTTVTPYRN